MATQTVKEYYEGLLKKAGVADDKRQAILTALDDENVSKALNEDLLAPRLRQDDYSRNMDALKSDKEKWTGFYQNLLQWKAENEQGLAALAAARTNGNVDPNNVDPNAGRTVLTVEALESLKKEFTEKQQVQERNFLTLLKGVGSLTSDYVTRFKEKPDLDAIEKIAIEKNVPLMQAYDIYIEPRVKALQTADVDARIAAARAEGAKDALSKRGMPGITESREFHPLLDRGIDDKNIPDKGPARDRWIRDQFIQDLNAPTATSGGSTG